MQLRSTRSNSQPQIPIDQEITKTCRLLKKQKERALVDLMAQQQHRRRLFGDHLEPKFEHNYYRRDIEAETYTIPPALINLVQNGNTFQGLESEDPNTHVKDFVYLCTTCKLNGLTQDQVLRMLFPFSLKGQASAWFKSIGGESLGTFDEVVRRFTAKYFPPAKMEKVRNQLYQFKQMSDESFTECWDRFQDILRKCPMQLLEEGQELQLFYKGLRPDSKDLVNASAGGSVKEKTYEEVQELLQRIAENGTNDYSERVNPPRKQAGLFEVNMGDRLEAQMATWMKNMEKIMKQQQGKPNSGWEDHCALCNGLHFTDQCPNLTTESVNFVKDRDQPRFPLNQQWNQQPRNQQWNAQGANAWQNQRPNVEHQPQNHHWTYGDEAGPSNFKRQQANFGNSIPPPYQQQDPILSNMDNLSRKFDQMLKHQEDLIKIGRASCRERV